jgi:hypothetical protein
MQCDVTFFIPTRPQRLIIKSIRSQSLFIIALLPPDHRTASLPVHFLFQSSSCLLVLHFCFLHRQPHPHTTHLRILSCASIDHNKPSHKSSWPKSVPLWELPTPSFLPNILVSTRTSLVWSAQSPRLPPTITTTFTSIPVSSTTPQETCRMPRPALLSPRSSAVPSNKS